MDHEAEIKDVPVDGFWSYTVYDAEILDGTWKAPELSELK